MSKQTERNYANFSKLTIGMGCDPELFLFDTSKDKFISGHGIIPGTKREPHYFPSGGSVQLDGVACEIGIPPAYTAVEWNNNITETLRDVKRLLPKNVVLKATPTAWFDKEYFDKEVPDSCKELGCDPDFDAYKNGAPNPRPNGLIEKDGKILRTGAGHVHISWGSEFDTTNENHRWDCITIAKNLDLLYGLVSPKWDTDTVRQQMYGAPGCYRPKSYGMEYRTPSNAWLTNRRWSTAMYNIVMSGVYFAYRYGLEQPTVYNPTTYRNMVITKDMLDPPRYVRYDLSCNQYVYFDPSFAFPSGALF